MDITQRTLKSILEEPSSIVDINNFYSPEMLYWEDDNGNILSVSAACEKITGYTSEEFINNPKLIKNIIFTEDLEIWEKRCEDVHLHDIDRIQFRINHKLEKIVWVEHDSQKLYDASGVYIGLRSSNRDITKRKYTDEIINSSSSVLFIWKNQEGFPVLFVSPNVENILGYTIEEFISGEVFYNDIIHPECVEKVRAEVRYNSKTRGKIFNHVPYRVIRKDNKIIWVSDNTVVKEGENGKITHFYGIITDITKSVEDENKLKSSEQKFEFSLEAAKIGSWGLDISTGNFTWSDQMEILFGLNNVKAKKRRKDFYDRVYREDKRKVVKAISKAIKENSYYRVEHRIVLPNGTTKWVLQEGKTFLDDNNKPDKMFGIVRDITNRKESEKLQKALYHISEEANSITSMNELYGKLHEIIATLMPANNFYIAIYNKRTNKISFPYYVDENKKTSKKRVFGTGLTEYILKKKKDIIITPSIYAAIKKRKEVDAEGKSPLNWVGIYLEFEGDYKGVLSLHDHYNPNAYSDKELRILQFVSKQIVKVLDKKYADMRLQKSVKELSEAKNELEIINENKDRFFSIIAHDLRSPFNTLLGVSEMISGDMEDMPISEIKEISSVIYSSTQNLFKLIENLLSWSRLQMGAFIVEPIMLEINDAANSVLEVLDISAKEKEITIINKLEKVLVYADEECVKTVLRNLISNAIKFTKRHGMVELSSKSYEKFVEIKVADSGVGMKPSMVEEIFSISKKTSTAGTESETGTGLGLILCKDLVEKNNGKIWVVSQLGKGSEFTFTLPKE